MKLGWQAIGIVAHGGLLGQWLRKAIMSSHYAGIVACENARRRPAATFVRILGSSATGAQKCGHEAISALRHSCRIITVLAGREIRAVFEHLSRRPWRAL